MITVRMAEFAFTKKEEILRTNALGSCVSVVFFHPSSLCAAITHIMLPHSSKRLTSKADIGKYADLVLPHVLTLFQLEKIAPCELKAMVFGGAKMFEIKNPNSMMNVGCRNLVAIKEWLDNFTIPIVGEDSGGTKGRSIHFDPVSAQVTLTYSNQVKKTFSFH